MPSSSKVFKGTPRTAALMQPFTAPAHLTETGVPFGRDMRTGKSFRLDPYKARERGELNGLDTQTEGERDTGKSALWKSIGILMAGIQAGMTQQWIADNDGDKPVTEEDLDIFRLQYIDQKPEEGTGEYGRMTKLLEGTFVRPGIDGFNPFDPSMCDLLAMTEIALNLAEVSVGRKLINYEPLAIQIGVSTMYNKARWLSGPELLSNTLNALTDDEIEDFQKDGKQQMATMLESRREKLLDEARALQLDDLPAGFAYVDELLSRKTVDSNIRAAEVRRDAGMMAAAVLRLSSGDFGLMTGAAPSMKQSFSSHMLTIERLNMGAMASVVWDSVAAKWQTTLIEQNQTAYLPYLRVGDEEADSYNSIMYLRFRDELSRKSRAQQTWNVNLVQFGERLANAGEPDSETRKLARAIQLGISQRIIGGMPYDEGILDGLTKYGMSDADAHTITGLPVGCFAYKAMNKPVVFFQHFLTDVAASVVPSNASNARMLNRVNVWSIKDVEQRAADKEALKDKNVEQEVQ